MLDRIEIDLRGVDTLTLYIDVADNSLSRKWLAALNDVLRKDLHLEKNYCWLGWTESERTANTSLIRSTPALLQSILPIWVTPLMIILP